MNGLREGLEALLLVQSIGAELRRETIIERTLTIALEALQGDRGVLILAHEGGVVLAGRAARNRDGIRVEIEQSPQPLAVNAASARIALVLERGEPMVIAGEGVVAPLNLSTTHGDRRLGALQIERTDPLASDALALLELLTTQAAIALGHAERHHDLREAGTLLREAVDSLELLLVERTGELHETSARLREAMAVQRKFEDDRDRLQQSVIELQRARLRELQTPMIPITDQILVMPLIGTMDRERAEQLLEVALDGADRRGARVVILDLTGLHAMDSSTADALLRCARGLELLGAAVVVTGIRPDFAQVLATQGIELELDTQRTLQRGLIRGLDLLRRRGAIAG